MYALYYYPGNASLLPHMVLREIGVPFDVRRVDREALEQKSPDYLKLNPHGTIPVLVEDDLALHEAAAIAIHLADRHPQAQLMPPPGTSARAHFYKWMLYLSNTVQAEYMFWFYPERHAAHDEGAGQVKAAAGAALEGMFERIAAQLGEGPWLLGEQFSAADLFLFMLTRWGRAMPKPPRALPAIAAHGARVAARPAVVATFEAEGLAAPYF